MTEKDKNINTPEKLLKQLVDDGLIYFPEQPEEFKEEHMNGKEWLAKQPASIRETLYIPEGSNYPAIKDSALHCENKSIDPEKPVLFGET